MILSVCRIGLTLAVVVRLLRRLLTEECQEFYDYDYEGFKIPDNDSSN